MALGASRKDSGGIQESKDFGRGVAGSAGVGNRSRRLIGSEDGERHGANCHGVKAMLLKDAGPNFVLPAYSIQLCLGQFVERVGGGHEKKFAVGVDRVWLGAYGMRFVFLCLRFVVGGRCKRACGVCGETSRNGDGAAGGY